MTIIIRRKGVIKIEKMLTVKDIQNELGLGKNSVYKLVNLTGFPKVKIGKKILIPKDEFEKFMKQHIGSQICLD